MSSRGKISSKASVLLACAAALVALLLSQPAYRQRPPRTSQPHPQQAAKPSGSGTRARVVKVIDGDTLQVLILGDGAAEPVKDTLRVYGINTPELHPRPGAPRESFVVEPFAREAQEYLALLCPVGSEITIVEKNRDRYGRLLGVVLLGDGRDANRLMVESGLARAYVLRDNKNDPLLKEYLKAQAEAEAAQRGQWKK
ncbi:MAG TPA: thermonuclease family protein [Planctomycetota bacterium]|nr:thermonuclease family protein [Planctomycetota bacterium]